MQPIATCGRKLLLSVVLGLLVSWVGGWGALAAPAGAATDEIRIVELQGTAEIFLVGASRWVMTQTNQTLHVHDRLRTATNSRLVLRWSDQSVVTFGALAELEILPPHEPRAESGLHLWKGLISFFHREEPGRIRLSTRGAIAGVKGTEFVAQVETINGAERTTFSVIDGEVEFGNAQRTITLTNGQQARVEEGQPPERTAGFIANNLLQWCFYYPAVLDLRDLPLTTEERNAFSESLAAYRDGDLLAALRLYPANRAPGSAAERIYHAALLLAVGQVQQTEVELARLPAAEPTERLPRLANALRTLIAAVKRAPNGSILNAQPSTNYQFATELLAASYYEQSRGVREVSLQLALQLAERAAAGSPEFGFAWERVAELEFSFGHTDRALEALNKSLARAPRNAQAVALNGFLFAAQNKISQAHERFDRAIGMDAALANAWLGRGLCRIRRGDANGGREDLLIAAALEPQRAQLRSYLGKAFANAGDSKRARHELDLAKGLDESDPTAWLYSALLNEQDNRINESIRDLEKSQELNENRRVYRSQLLLDQDRAVRSQNLARAYQDAGMTDVAFREASRAVNADYGNYSAHYFLANSYNALRDPRLVNLRYETAENAEYLLANLMAPVGAGVLSPAVSQQEYSKLFERDRLGVTSQTEYLDRGAWLERGAQFGTFGNTSYSVEGVYHRDPGERPNNDLEQSQVAFLLKQQFTPQDSAFVQISHFNATAGDVAQRYDPQSADLAFRSHETQDALVNVGYHHEWSPGVHTLVLAGYLPDQLRFTTANFPTFLVTSAEPLAYPVDMTQSYHGAAKIYFAEAQQILQHNPQHLSIFGTRFQWGKVDANNQQMNPSDWQAYFPEEGMSASDQNLTLDIRRWSVYGYHHWEIVNQLWLVGGVSYDHLEFPENFLFAPLSSRTRTEDKVLPKAGVIWSPAKDTTLRFAYTRSLAGATLEQSYRLEPAQVAGFSQAYRGIIPESALGGPTPGAPFDTYGLAFEQKLTSTTFFGVTGEILDSALTRTIGGYYSYTDYDTGNTLDAIPADLRQKLDYTEKSLVATLNQLVGRDWSFGVRYRLTRADLKQQLTEVVDPFVPLTNVGDNWESVLQQISLDAAFNHPSGFFARFNALWSRQSNQGYSPEQPGDNFWQLNVWAGYRFPQRRAEVALGLLNLTDQDYHLNPLTPYNELPHGRTLAMRLLINF